jgi:ADP-heptose:LPS heptosyltransferase
LICESHAYLSPALDAEERLVITVLHATVDKRKFYKTRIYMNILVLKSYGIGNVLMMTPMVRELHAKGHKVFLLYDAGPLGGPTEELLGGWECIEEMKGFDSAKSPNGDKYIQWITKIKPELCIQSFPGDDIFNWFYQYIPCEVRRAPRPEEFTKHETEYNLDLVRDLVGETDSVLYSMPGSNLDAQPFIPPYLLQHDDKPRVVLCPCFKKEGNWQKKNWGVENFSELARMLVSKGYQPVLVDGPDGIGVCNIINYFCPEAINLAGITSIAETKYVLENAYAVIANDCGPAHMAAALGKTTMVIFGPTSVICKQPMGKDVIVLRTGIEHDNCKSGRFWDGCYCITKLLPTMVMRAFMQLVVKEPELVEASNG